MSKFEKAMQSPFSLIFGFISSLISTNFIRAASSSIFRYDEFPLIINQIIIVILCGFWFFYIIYGTVVWLLFTEYKPYEAKIPPSLQTMIFLRFLEFIPFIWLYDIIRIIDFDKSDLVLGQTVPSPMVNPFLFRPLSRLALNLGFILFTWSIWKILFSQVKEGNNSGEDLWSILLLLLFAFIFGSSYFWLGHSRTIHQAMPIIILYVFTVLYIALDFCLIHSTYYRTINTELEDIFKKKP
jgi:hypothetical protein